MGTLSLPLRVAVRRLREKGVKIGFLRIKWFRPFATKEIRAALAPFKAVAVIDRDYSYGSPNNSGVLFNEMCSALYSLENRPKLFSFIAGLGGREIHQRDVDEMLRIVQEGLAGGGLDQENHWIGVRR
jgi:pyruvate ferredoxin oxidoreductase alpha subunit